jgi:hypothetical protein
MQTINIHIPLKLRLRGELSEANWADLEKALLAQYTRAIERSLAELAKSRFGEQEARKTFTSGLSDNG